MAKIFSDYYFRWNKPPKILITEIFGVSGLDPTFVVGGIVNNLGSNARLGGGNYLIAEADESDASFLKLQPTMVVLTNIDQDHMGTYDQKFSQLCDAFSESLKSERYKTMKVL